MQKKFPRIGVTSELVIAHAAHWLLLLLTVLLGRWESVLLVLQIAWIVSGIVVAVVTKDAVETTTGISPFVQALASIGIGVLGMLILPGAHGHLHIH